MTKINNKLREFGSPYRYSGNPNSGPYTLSDLFNKEGSLWSNPDNLTDETGKHLTKPSVYRAYKAVVKSIGRPDARFHDLRHSYAVAAIRSGDDIKAVQGNLGHATATFTLDVYGHVTDQMKQDSAARMEEYIKTVSAV